MDVAQLERLAVLSEELGEVQQVIGKILRHGYESKNPLEEDGATNRQKLELELGDVICAMGLMVQEKDVNPNTLEQRSFDKVVKLNKWMHHNKVEI